MTSRDAACVLFMRPCGTVEPRRKVDKVKSKSFMKYEPGAKGDKEQEMHDSTLKATQASRKAKKALESF